MLPIRDENAHQALFSNDKIDRIRCAQTTISLNASTRCERIDVQKSDGCMPRFLYIDFQLLGRLLGNAGGDSPESINMHVLAQA